MPSLAASLANLANLNLAQARHRPWRPWRSPQESYVIRRMVWQWLVYRGPKWAARTLARWLGVHHHYVQKLVEEFKSDPARMWREVRASGYTVATFKEFEQTRQSTRQMRASGLLRPLEWRVRVRDTRERDRILKEVYCVRKWDSGRWPKRAVWKTVRAYAKRRGRIPREIPPWATPEFSMFLANSGIS